MLSIWVLDPMDTMCSQFLNGIAYWNMACGSFNNNLEYKFENTTPTSTIKQPFYASTWSYGYNVLPIGNGIAYWNMACGSFNNNEGKFENATITMKRNRKNN